MQSAFFNLDLLQLTLYICKLLLQHSVLLKELLVSSFMVCLVLLLLVCLCNGQLLLLQQALLLLKQLPEAAAFISACFKLGLQFVDVLVQSLICCA